MTVIRIIALSGSRRAASTNTALLRAVAASAPGGVLVEIYPLNEFPLFNPDVATFFERRCQNTNGASA